MTDRLYYIDPYLRAFDATVDRVDERDGRFVVRLNRTAFYPTSGGQPFDTGTLGNARVVEVLDEDDGSIAHVVEGGAPPDDGAQSPATTAAPPPQCRPARACLHSGKSRRTEPSWPCASDPKR